MSALKTVGVIGTISGIGLIGYYLLNKYKPTIAQTQTEEIKGQGYVLRLDIPEHRKLWSIVAQYGYDNLGKNQAYLDLKNQLLTQKPLIISDADFYNLERFFSDMNDKGVSEQILGKALFNLDSQKYWWEKRTKGLEEEIFGFNKFGNSILGVKNCEYKQGQEDPCAYNYNVPFQGRDYWRYSGESQSYFWKIDPSGKNISIVASNCVELDRDIKRIIDRIAQQTRNEPNEDRRRVLAWYKDILEDSFKLYECRDKIEKQRLLESAKQETLFSIKAENSVLGANQKNQNIYLGVGALVLVLSVAILSSGKSASTPTSSTSSPKSFFTGILSNIVIFGGLAGMGYLIFKKPKVVLPKT